MDELTREQKNALEQKHIELVKVIKAFENLEKGKDWPLIKELVFSPSMKSIERLIFSAATSKEVNINEIYKLQGEWVWCRQFTDTNSFIAQLKAQLENINKQIK